jgi:hypothetical protein
VSPLLLGLLVAPLRVAVYYDVIPSSGSMKRGDILGHECCGVVDKVGERVKNFRVGDRVGQTARRMGRETSMHAICGTAALAEALVDLTDACSCFCCHRAQSSAP